MKIVYFFLSIYSLQGFGMDKPLPPLPVRIGSSRVKKPAAAGNALKRSSDEEKKDQPPALRRRQSLDVPPRTFLEAAKKSVAQTAAPKTLAEEIRQEIAQGGLGIISENPPIAEVVVRTVPYRCRLGCRKEFVSKEEENQHILQDYKIIAADRAQEEGIDWGSIDKLQGPCLSLTWPQPFPEPDREEGELQEGEVQEGEEEVLEIDV